MLGPRRCPSLPLVHTTRTSPLAAVPAIVIFRHPPSSSDTGMTASIQYPASSIPFLSTAYPPTTHRFALDIARPRGRLNRAISDMWGGLFRHRRAISPQRIETSMLTAIWAEKPRSRAAPCPGPRAARGSPRASPAARPATALRMRGGRGSGRAARRRPGDSRRGGCAVRRPDAALDSRGAGDAQDAGATR